MSNSIEIIKNNWDKKITYKILNAKLKESYNNGNFHEVINLSYAMIEDRLKTILDLLYIIEDRKEKLYPCDSIDKIIRPILKFNLNGDKKNIYKTNNISTKLNIIKRILKTKEKNAYIRDCKDIFQKNIGIKEMINWINIVENWCKTRNEIIHGAFNKNYESFNLNLEDVAKVGYDLSITIKQYTNKIKTNKTQISVRDKWKLINKISEYNLSVGILNEYNNFYLDNNQIEIGLYKLNLFQDGNFIKLNMNNIYEILTKTNKNKKETYIIDFVKQILEYEYNALYYSNYMIENKEQMIINDIKEIFNIKPKIVDRNFQLYLNYSKIFKKEIKAVLIDFLKAFRNFTVSDIPEEFLKDLRKDKEFLIKWGETMGKLIFNFNNPYLYIEKEFYNDKEFLLTLLNNDNLIPAEFIDLDLLLKIKSKYIFSKTFVDVVVKNDNYKELLNDNYKGYNLLDFIKKDGDILKYSSEKIKDTKKYVKIAVISEPESFIHCSKKMQEDEELFQIFLENYFFDFDELENYLLPFINNKKIALSVLKNKGLDMKCFSDEIRNSKEYIEYKEKYKIYNPFFDDDDEEMDLPF